MHKLHKQNPESWHYLENKYLTYSTCGGHGKKNQVAWQTGQNIVFSSIGYDSNF